MVTTVTCLEKEDPDIDYPWKLGQNIQFRVSYNESTPKMKRKRFLHLVWNKIREGKKNKISKLWRANGHSKYRSDGQIKK